MGANYIPENDYPSNGFKPFKGFQEALCTRCDHYYAMLQAHKLTKTPFPPQCERHIENKLLALNPSDFNSHQEYLDTAIILDPIAWAQAEFGWEPRWYQVDFLSCTSQYKVLRQGRQCLAEGTLVATPGGPVEIQNLVPGDTVYDEHGKPIKVKEVYDQGTQDVVDLVNHGKVYATCTLDHQWLTHYLVNSKVRKVSEFKRDSVIARTEVNAPLGNIKNDTAYALGAFLGDGCSRDHGLCISSADEGVISKIGDILKAPYKKCHPNNYTWSFSSKERDKIDHYYDWCHGRYAHEKIVDLDVVKTWDRDSVLSLVAGLIDTDGSVHFTGKEIIINLSMQALSIIKAVQWAFMALWQVPVSISLDNREKYVNGPCYTLSLRNIHHCKRVLQELDPYLCVERKKFKIEYSNLQSNNFNARGIGVKPTNPRKLRCYDIHVDSLTNLYLLSNGLVTHNSGKTAVMIMAMLHFAVTNKNETILVIAPYERQVTNIFDEVDKLIQSGTTIKDSLMRYTRTPSRLDFYNGTKILGFSSGSNSTSGSDKIRGQTSSFIILDEVDYIEDADIDAVLAIVASRPDARIIAASTPAGWRKKFYKIITDKNLKFKEFWFIGEESPKWTPNTEAFFRGIYDEAKYEQEIHADFAEIGEGVFKKRHVDSSIHEYSTKDTGPEPNSEYILGVDWNKSAGTHMVIMQWANKQLKMAKKIIVPESEYTQTDSVQLITTLNKLWGFKHIFVDAGYGGVQVELLKKEALRNPSSMLDVKTNGIHMNQSLNVIDPTSGEPVKRNAKHFLVEQTKKLLEDGFIILPKEEDTIVTGDGQQGLIQQMRNFKVDSYSVYGLPKYSQGQDHTLTAFFLACGGFYWKEGDLRGVPYSKTIGGVEVSDELQPQSHPAVIEREADKKAGWNLISTTNKKQAPSPLHSRQLPPPSVSRRNGLSNTKRHLDQIKNSTLSRQNTNSYKRNKF